MKKINEKKKGISLIVLIITIIVIIILAVAVILTIAKNNPMESAKKARFQSDLKTMQEEVNMYESKVYADANIKGEAYITTTVDGEEMVAKFPSTKDYSTKVKVVDGKVLVIEDELNEQEKLWANEIGIPKIASKKWNGTADTSFYDSTKTEFNIYTAEELAGLAQLVNETDESGNQINDFENITINLMDDIDLNGEKYEWTPIGIKWEKGFDGKFDGHNHTISNMKITGDYDRNALFGFIENGMRIYNLIVRDSYIKGAVVGSIVGDLQHATIQNCASINNYIEGIYSAGGIVCTGVDFNILSCYNTSEVLCTYNGGSSSNGAGGIVVGDSFDGSSVKNCYNTGKISAPNAVAGGIVSYEYNYDIKNCYNIRRSYWKIRIYRKYTWIWNR